MRHLLIGSIGTLLLAVLTLILLGAIAEESAWRVSAALTGVWALAGSTKAMTEELRAYFAAPPGKGVLIATVGEGSAADKAGLRAGDVLVAVDGTPVGRPGDVMREIVPAPTGASVSLATLRERGKRGPGGAR